MCSPQQPRGLHHDQRWRQPFLRALHPLEATNSGDACVNDCSVHPLVPELPFGGVGNSGMGKYHGRWGFEAFTNARGVL
jgi:acyl-CoA reductase-like NAD-dependent aldehyde dehydrogenase